MKSFRQQYDANRTEAPHENKDNTRQTAESLAAMSPDQLTATLYDEVAKAKAQGTLSDSDLLRFCDSVAPMLNQEQADKLQQLIRRLLG